MDSVLSLVQNWQLMAAIVIEALGVMFGVVALSYLSLSLMKTIYVNLCELFDLGSSGDDLSEYKASHDELLAAGWNFDSVGGVYERYDDEFKYTMNSSGDITTDRGSWDSETGDFVLESRNE